MTMTPPKLHTCDFLYAVVYQVTALPPREKQYGNGVIKNRGAIPPTHRSPSFSGTRRLWVPTNQTRVYTHLIMFDTKNGTLDDSLNKTERGERRNLPFARTFWQRT